MIGSILLFLVVLSVLVLVHEAGHFFTALWAGAKVEEFGIGFPPRAWSFMRKGIRYSINWIPLGGFVKIKGESGEDRSDPDSFASKPAWKRFIILAAGVTMNFVLAAVLLTIGFGIGMPEVIDSHLPASAHVEQNVTNIVTVLADSDAVKQGLQVGDQLISIDNHVFSSAEQAQQYIHDHGDLPMMLVVKRGDQNVNATVTASVLPESDGKKVLGIGLIQTGLVTYPWYELPLRGVLETWTMTKEIVAAFWQLISNLIVHQQVSADLSGPVGIAVMTGQVAQLGLVYLLQFAAVLSINLAVINFVPFPALDGGRALFLLIEKIKGKPMKHQVEAIINNIGFALLMVLVVLITYRDVVRLGSTLVGGSK